MRKEGNYEEAYDWLTKAYKAGSLYAQYELLNVYYFGGWGVCAGSGVDVGYKNTWDAAEKDPVLCLLRHWRPPLAKIELLVEQTISNCLEGLTSADIADYYLQRKEYEIGFEWLNKGVTEGCARCCFRL